MSIKINHVTKRYDQQLALNDVNLEIGKGQIVGLLGPNGAGKSTLMKSVIGLLKYEGQITVRGLNNKSSEAKRIVGYIPELPALYPNLTVSEHMEFIARAYKLTNYADRVSDLLDAFELTDKKKKFGDELSKGMQQKLNICLGLLPDPDLVLMDEPMVGLDPHAIKELKREIDEMRNRGKTLLISTHIIDSVDMLWDRTIIMQSGSVMACVERSELEKSGKSLEDYFFEVTENRNADASTRPADGATAG